MDGKLPAGIVLFLLVAPAIAQTPALQPATSAQPSAPALTFSARPSQVGQQSEQTVETQLALKTRTRQGAEILQEGAAKLHRIRERRVVIAKVEQGLAVAARVKYPSSNVTRDGDQQATDPISGKEYYCERRGESLHVQTLEGKVPPQEEFALVAQNMDMLGRPNPLVEYLAGKRVEVGQRVAVPPEIAQRLVGLNSDLGSVTRFDLTLEAIVQEAGLACGRFQTDLEAARADSSQLRLIVSGTMVIDAASTRVVRSDLSGPIGMSQSLLDPNGPLQLDSTGSLSLKVATRYGVQPRRR